MSELLAWLVVAGHAAYLLYQTCGGLLALRHPVWLYPHLAAVTWGVVIIVMQWPCPLTVLEKRLWARAGEEPYVGSYLDHYLFGVVLPDGWQAWVYAGHLVVIAAVYVFVASQRGAARTEPVHA